MTEPLIPIRFLLFFGSALNQEEKSPETYKKSQTLCRIYQHNIAENSPLCAELDQGSSR